MRSLRLDYRRRARRGIAIIGLRHRARYFPKVAAGQRIDINRVMSVIAGSGGDACDARANLPSARRHFDDVTHRRRRRPVLRLNDLAFGVADVCKVYRTDLELRHVARLSRNLRSQMFLTAISRIGNTFAPASVITQAIAQGSDGNSQTIGRVGPIPVETSQRLENEFSLNTR